MAEIDEVVLNTLLSIPMNLRMVWG